MKTLRELELEYEVGALKQRVMELECRQGIYDHSFIRAEPMKMELPIELPERLMLIPNLNCAAGYDERMGIRVDVWGYGKQKLAWSQYMERYVPDEVLPYALTAMHERFMGAMLTWKRGTGT